MTERIHFPEDKIPQIIALIRRGLEAETDKGIVRNLNMQLRELERYHADRLAPEPVLRAVATKKKR